MEVKLGSDKRRLLNERLKCDLSPEALNAKGDKWHANVT